MTMVKIIMMALILVACSQEPEIIVPVPERAYGGLSLEEVSMLNRRCNAQGKSGKLTVNEYLEVVEVECGTSIFNKIINLLNSKQNNG